MSNTWGKCKVTGKRRFRDHREAVKALRGAVTKRHFAEIDGVPTHRRERRTYECSACSGWHLTSWERYEAA